MMLPSLVESVRWVFVEETLGLLSHATSRVRSEQSMMIISAPCFPITFCKFIMRLYAHVLLPTKYYSEIIVSKRIQKVLQALQVIIEAIADHLVHQLRGHKVRSYLSLHRAEFNHVHTDDSGAAANLTKEIEQLIPMQSAWFGCSHCRHLARIECIRINSHIGMLAQAFPWNDGCSFCKLIAPDDFYVWRSFHELSFFVTEAADANFREGYAHIYNTAFN